MAEFRLRVCYRKAGRLRFLSHLEVVHALERGVRRAQLPYAVTRGFSPHMRISFGPALPVGTAGLREYLDLVMTRYTDADEVLGRLSAALPADLSLEQARYVSDREPALAKVATIAPYVVDVHGKGFGPREMQAALDSVVASGELQVEHKGKTKSFDLARSLPKGAHARSSELGSIVELTVRMGPEGSLRPEALLTTAIDVASLDATVASVTRTDTLVETEEGVWTRPI